MGKTFFSIMAMKHVIKNKTNTFNLMEKEILNVRKQFFCFVLFCSVLAGSGVGAIITDRYATNLSNANIRVSSWLLKGNVWLVITRMYGMQSHFKKENEVVLS